MFSTIFDVIQATDAFLGKASLYISPPVRAYVTCNICQFFSCMIILLVIYNYQKSKSCMMNVFIFFLCRN